MRKIILFGLLTLLITGAIWGNSLKTVEQSRAQSAQVAETLKPVLDPQEKMEMPVFHTFIRKHAHAVEFFALGLSVACLTFSLGSYLKRRFISMPLLIVLFVAVGDEYIQHFSDRSSQVTDVMLDFAGALAGLVVVVLLWLALRWLQRTLSGKELRKE